jgi:hypothetical protein
MTLSDLASLGSFVSGLAVLASLLYLAVQLRQARKHQQSLMRQGQTGRLLDLYMQIAGNEELATIFDKGRDVPNAAELSSTEYLRLAFVYRAFTLSREESYLQYKAGLLDEATLESLKAATRRLLSVRGARAHWKINRDNFSTDYAAWMDELLASTGVSASSEFERWKAAVAAG